MKLKGTLFAVGAATLLCAVPATPAAAMTPPTSAALLGGACSPGLSITHTAGGPVAAIGSLSCSSSIDYIQVDVQLKRDGVVVATNSCGSTSWSVSCAASTGCRSGAYQASAQFQAYSTSGNGAYSSYTTPVQTITC